MLFHWNLKTATHYYLILFMDLKELLVLEKRNFLIKANGGIALPAAGFIYWLAAGIAGFYLNPQLWIFAVSCGSGLLFPLGMLLANPMKSDITAKSEISSLLLPALLSMLTFWPLVFATSKSNPSFAPLAIGIGMSIHWPVIGWVYGLNKSFIGHHIVRVAGCTAIWFLLPDHRFTLLPLFIALVYFITVFVIRRDVQLARQYAAKA
jgi:hypothetical protein